MKRIDTIVANVTGLEFTKFSDMTLDAQVSICYNMARNANNSIVWWTQQAEASESGDFRARARDEIALAHKAFISHCVFLNKAANYREAMIQTIGFDHANYNSEEGRLENDEVFDERVAVKSAPHEWARRLLQQYNMWPSDVPNDMELIAYNLEQICERAAGQYIGRMLIGYLQDDDYIPARTDGRDLIIMAGSKLVCDLSYENNKQRLHRKILELAMKYTPYINDRPYNRKEINEAWRVCVERDEDDLATKSIDDAVREVKKDVRDALRTAKILEAVKRGADDLRKSGATDETIDAFINTVTAK